jgi:hypothetical protein
MINFEKEFRASERIRELHAEADNQRLARGAAVRRPAGRPWRARIAIAIARRITGAAEAS